MKRRQFLALSALTLAAPAIRADGHGHEDYTREAYQAALASGEPFMLDFYAPW